MKKTIKLFILTLFAAAAASAFAMDGVDPVTKRGKDGSKQCMNRCGKMGGTYETCKYICDLKP